MYIYVLKGIYIYIYEEIGFSVWRKQLLTNIFQQCNDSKMIFKLENILTLLNEKLQPKRKTKMSWVTGVLSMIEKY